MFRHEMEEKEECYSPIFVVNEIYCDEEGEQSWYAVSAFYSREEAEKFLEEQGEHIKDEKHVEFVIHAVSTEGVLDRVLTSHDAMLQNIEVARVQAAQKVKIGQVYTAQGGKLDGLKIEIPEEIPEGADLPTTIAYYEKIEATLTDAILIHKGNGDKPGQSKATEALNKAREILKKLRESRDASKG